MSKARAVKVIERLRELNLTYQDLADAAEVSTRAVSYWLNYQKEPRLTFLQTASICALLQWSADELAQAYYPGRISSQEIADLPGDYAKS